jgi:hypothetical protein
MPAWFQSIAEGLGRGGNEWSSAVEHNTEFALETIKNKLLLQEIQQRMRESEQRMGQANRPQPYVVGTPGGGTSVFSINPLTGQPGSPTTVVPGQVRPDYTGKIQRKVGEEMHEFAYDPHDPLKQIDMGVVSKESTAQPTQFADWRKRNPDAPLEDYLKLIQRYRGKTGEGGGVTDVDTAADMVIGGLSVPSAIALVGKGNAQRLLSALREKGWTGRKLNAQEQREKNVLERIEPALNRLQEVLDKSGERGGNSWADVAKAHLQFREYKLGKMPDGPRKDMIKAAAALQVMGAAPWVSIGRGKYLFETIVQHLPSPTDTPALLNDKLQFLRNIIDDAKSSLDVTQGNMTYTQPGSVPNGR